MNLFDPLRPYLPNGQKAWLRGDIAIPNLEVFPKPSGNIELAIMLPIKEARIKSKRFSIEIRPESLEGYIDAFITYPEYFCEENFISDIESFQPELRTEPSKSVPETKTIKPPQRTSLGQLEF